MKQQTYDPSFATEREKAEAKAVEDATQAHVEGDPSFETENARAEATALEHAREAEQEEAAEYGAAPNASAQPSTQPSAQPADEDTAIETDASASVGCDVECKDTERAGRSPGETFSAGVWDADMTSHGGRSRIAELERRASEQEVHPDDIEDEE